MVIDTSALIAILLVEADRDLYIEAIERSEIRLMSAANALEGAIVAEARKGAAGEGNSTCCCIVRESTSFQWIRRWWRRPGGCGGNSARGIIPLD